MIRSVPGMPPTLQILVDALRVLPGVDPKSAQRMMYHLIRHDREDAMQLAQVLSEATESTQHRNHCNAPTEQDICETCLDTRRDTSILCVVETLVDQMMIERMLIYRDQYFVLMGRLSPLDNIGPKEIHLERLLARATDPMLGGPCTEVILAANFTSKGEAAAYCIGEMLKVRGIKATRLAHGVPVGGELGYVDAGTIARVVLNQRQLWSSVAT